MSGAAVERYTFCRDHFAECACDLEPHQNGDYVSFGVYEDALLREAALTAELQQCRQALEAALPHLIAHHTDQGAYKAARMVEEAIAQFPTNQEGRPSERGNSSSLSGYPQPLQASPSAPAAPSARAALKERT